MVGLFKPRFAAVLLLLSTCQAIDFSYVTNLASDLYSKIGKPNLTQVMNSTWFSKIFSSRGYGDSFQMFPSAPDCPLFQCPSGQRAFGKQNHQIWSYGCRQSGMSLLSKQASAMSSHIKPLIRQSLDEVNSCCINQSICKQTCGMTSKRCHDAFVSCYTKACGGGRDYNCLLQAMLNSAMAEKDPDKPWDQTQQCKAYDQGQQDACTCVATEDYEKATDEKLQDFYKRFNPSQLDSDGNLIGYDDFWTKWRGKEAEMFNALVTKYQDQAVEVRSKPGADEHENLQGPDEL
eukprot:gnl/MRDRNA2_/MRDRNA2_44381_c0_seq1.p1 gnl/MRDRNA2_/MRDRNA2_44381_c0~~gnl/MRDRNA2_/MRDRNA2_44381_c0_seq1.p1  ORF type:complete len:290 (-),score=47.47 gnl/MRDRNA2_/MRDRNA2_44381_c0_seq1:25-894(-)